MRLQLIAAAVVAATLLSPAAMRAPQAQSTVTGRVIVKYKADSGLMHTQALTANGQRLSQMRTLSQRLGAELRAGADISGDSHVVFAAGMNSEQLAARLSSDSEVEYAVPDRKMRRLSAPADPLYGSVPVSGGTGGPIVGQWYLKPPGPTNTAAKTAPAAINAEGAWDISTGSANIVVAVLDTGLRFDHPDFQGGNVLLGYDMIAADEPTTTPPTFVTAADGNGRDPDASDPGDGVTTAKAGHAPYADCKAENSSWHGTQTLSFIGATTNNSIGMASVGRGVTVMPVRVLGKCGEGFSSDIIAGMLWAGGVSTPSGVPANAHPARVVNLSLGVDGACDPASQSAITQLVNAGVVVVVSAGNSSGIAVASPANCVGAIAVAGLRQDGDKLGVSSLGPEVAISAPGSNCPSSPTADCGYPMLAAFNTGTIDPVVGAVGGSYTDAFTVFTGTSFSAPLVAGAAALMLSVQPSLTPAQVKARLMSSARPFPTTGSTAPSPVGQCGAPTSTPQTYCYCPNPSSTTASVCGAGMLDVRAALVAAAAVQTTVAVATTAPVIGSPITFTSTSTLGNGATVASQVWTLTPGATGATITSGQGTSQLVVTPTAGGTLLASLTVTDSLGSTSTASASAIVPPVAVVIPPSAGSSGGGGALGVGWLALLMTAVLALVGIDRVERRRRRRAGISERTQLQRTR